jgi:hypothetical protein
MDTILYFLQSIPESMGIIALSLALARVPLRWKYILGGGVPCALVTYFVRELPVTFGLHLPIILFIVFMLIVKLTKLTPSKVIIVLFTSVVTLALLEFLITSTALGWLHITADEAMTNLTLWTLLGLAQAIILNIIALVVPRFMKPVEGTWKV